MSFNQELKLVAEQHHRSINSEAIVCLTRVLLPGRISPRERLRTVQALRSQIKPDIVTPEEIAQAISSSRL
jgi:plasmid stability protein